MHKREFIEIPAFTPAEEDVVWRIIHGLTDQEIAKARGITVGTARQQVKAVLQKARARNKALLASLAALHWGFDQLDFSLIDFQE